MDGETVGDARAGGQNSCCSTLRALTQAADGQGRAQGGGAGSQHTLLWLVTNNTSNQSSSGTASSAEDDGGSRAVSKSATEDANRATALEAAAANILFGNLPSNAQLFSAAAGHPARQWRLVRTHTWLVAPRCINVPCLCTGPHPPPLHNHMLTALCEFRCSLLHYSSSTTTTTTSTSITTSYHHHQRTLPSQSSFTMQSCTDHRHIHSHHRPLPLPQHTPGALGFTHTQEDVVRALMMPLATLSPPRCSSISSRPVYLHGLHEQWATAHTSPLSPTTTTTTHTHTYTHIHTHAHSGGLGACAACGGELPAPGLPGDPHPGWFDPRSESLCVRDLSHCV